MRRSLLLGVLFACDSGAQTGPPRRDCELVVWHKAQSRAAQVEIVGSWDGFKRPGRIVPADRSDGWRVTGFDLAPGDYTYAIVEDGAWLTDQVRGTTALQGDREVSWVRVEDCSMPALAIDDVKTSADGSASASLRFLASKTGEPLASVNVDGVAARAELDPARGTIALTAGALAPGKHVAALRAKDTRGREASARITMWIESRPFDWRDAPIYQVMVDRYRDRDGKALAAPSSPTSFAGGAVEGVRKHLDDIAQMGFRAIWLSPIYANPIGEMGSPPRTYTAYHGYWPSQPRALDPRFATDAELDAFVRDAHARGMRVIFDVVPHHVHATHPYAGDASFVRSDAGGCSCGAPGCDWANHAQSCWFAPYLPTLEWRNPIVADRASEDVAWWIDRWDGDGVRIDAVPMMPRLAARRVAWIVRSRFDHPSQRTLVLGENFTGPQGYDLLRYELGPQGLDSQFHFPLMWAMRRTIALPVAPLSDIDAAVRAGEDAWQGSGAVMGLMIGNHDVARFASVSAGDGDLDGWTPSPQPTDASVYTRQRLALALVYTLPGAPVVYYGDELGLSGRNDPDSRRVMPDDAQTTSDMRGVRDFVTRVAKLRDCSGALRRGAYRTIAATSEVLAFAREAPNAATAIVVITRAPAQPPSGLVPVDVLDALTGRTDTSAMGAYDVAIFLPRGNPCLP